jgi:hypothetical protein
MRRLSNAYTLHANEYSFSPQSGRVAPRYSGNNKKHGAYYKRYPNYLFFRGRIHIMKYTKPAAGAANLFSGHTEIILHRKFYNIPRQFAGVLLDRRSTWKRFFSCECGWWLV